MQILRQYALLSSLLQSVVSETASGNPGKAPIISEQQSSINRDMPSSFAAPSASSREEQSDGIPIAISLSSLPQNCCVAAAFPLEYSPRSISKPARHLPFPFEQQNSPIVYAGFQILPNGDVSASKQSLSAKSSNLSFLSSLDQNSSANGQAGDENANANQITNKKLAKAIDVCGDMGVWIEWIRGEKTY